MADNSTNYGRKGTCFGYFMVFFILFIMTVVYVYNGNWNALPVSK
jgi:hypothetical protein